MGGSPGGVRYRAPHGANKYDTVLTVCTPRAESKTAECAFDSTVCALVLICTSAFPEMISYI